MGVRRFDRKFGRDLLAGLPESPAVYLFRDASGEVLYAGKARNIRRRLRSYRTASRRKAHRRMRAVVRDAHSVEVRLQPSEEQALLVENELIRKLRPRYNVDGAFAFLYPAIGTGESERRLVLCFTSRIEAFADLRLAWHGTFRPRKRAREAFDALAALAGRIGHAEPRSRLPEAPRLRGSRLVALRRTPPELLAATGDFLSGRSDALLQTLFARLLESRAARHDAAAVQADLHLLASFYARDVCRLRDARRAVGRTQDFVPQDERDALFIAARMR